MIEHTEYVTELVALLLLIFPVLCYALTVSEQCMQTKSNAWILDNKALSLACNPIEKLGLTAHPVFRPLVLKSTITKEASAS